MVGSRFTASRYTSSLRAALPAAALAAAVLVLDPAPSGADLSTAGPATCLPHCDNALYPYTEHLRVTSEETAQSLPGSTPPAG